MIRYSHELWNLWGQWLQAGFGFSIHLALNECFKSLLELGAEKKILRIRHYTLCHRFQVTRAGHADIGAVCYKVDTCNYTFSKSHVQRNCGGLNSVPLCWRQGLCLHKPMPLTIVWWEVAAGPAIATSNLSVRQTISSLRECVDQMNSNFLYCTWHTNIWTQYTNDLDN